MANDNRSAPDETPKKLIVSVSAISLNFDYVSSDPDKKRSEEIRVLLPRNKKPPKGSEERKPAGFGNPTGQVDQNETKTRAVERETEAETGYSVRQIIGEAFIVEKPWVPNIIHVFIIESRDFPGPVKEKDEIDFTIDPWHTLKEVFTMPAAQDKYGSNRNPYGIYYSHKQRLFRAIETMIYHPEDLIDGDKIAAWLKPNRRALIAAMAELHAEGYLDELEEKYAYYAVEA